MISISRLTARIFRLPSFIHKIIGLVFPEYCLGCGKHGTYLCPPCLGRLNQAEPIGNLNALACFDYHDGCVKKAIWRLKYKGVTSLAPLLAQLIYDKLIDELADETAISPGLGEDWLVIPIPLSNKRRQARGYNQSALIAKHLIKLAPKHLRPANNILIKIKDTPAQVSIANRRERLTNLKGAFALAKPKHNRPSGSIMRGRRIILVDDVITTGGTMREAMHVLNAAGAKIVLGVAVAHG
ncbi:MAG: phosphoribosyltransferase family protein [Patescibacteria group bacterium]|nr:phosphoribosyltransferase family protein [Patescibacteria group bacterium]